MAVWRVVPGRGRPGRFGRRARRGSPRGQRPGDEPACGRAGGQVDLVDEATGTAFRQAGAPRVPEFLRREGGR